MTDHNRLNEKTLETVCGGKLTPEAQNWIDTFRDEVLSRAGKLACFAELAFNYVTNTEKEYDVEGLKSAIIGYGIDVSDLNLTETK